MFLRDLQDRKIYYRDLNEILERNGASKIQLKSENECGSEENKVE